jgi:hypothetical protein
VKVLFAVTSLVRSNAAVRQVTLTALGAAFAIVIGGCGNDCSEPYRTTYVPG